MNISSIYNFFRWPTIRPRAITYNLEQNCPGVVENRCGVAVSEQTAGALPALRCALDAICSGIAGYDCLTFRTTPDGKEEATDHPVYKLLKRKPCRRMSCARFYETITYNALFRIGIAEITRDGAGFPINLEPIPYDLISVDWDNAGLPVYIVGKGTPGEKPIADANAICLTAPDKTGARGFDLLMDGRDALATGLAAELYTQSFFANGCNPGSVTTIGPSVDNKGNAVANYKEGLRKNNTGAANANKNLVIDHDWKFEPLENNNNNNQLVQVRTQTGLAIAQLLNVPPTRLHIDVGSHPGGTQEEQNKSFCLSTLAPWQRRLCQEFNDKLFTEAEQEMYFTEFDTNDYLSDYIFQTLSTATGKQAFLTQNEARALIGYGPTDELKPVAPTPPQEGNNGQPVIPNN